MFSHEVEPQLRGEKKVPNLGFGHLQCFVSLFTTMLRLPREIDGLRPQDILETLAEDGSIDPAKFILYMQREEDEMESNSFEFYETCVCGMDEEDSFDKRPKRKKRSVKAHRFEAFDKNGNIVPLVPTNTMWWINYVSKPQVTKPWFLNKF